jgi:aerobic carbon-monoxide dehydrogenase medium subunit
VKPAAFDYLRARSVAEAAVALAEAQGEAKLVAGGQSLGPMLNLRLVQPRLLIDIGGIPELAAAEADGDGIRIGACVTAASIEDGRVPTAGAPMLPRIAGGIAYRAVRNRGTIGGSLCHADPAADWVSALAVLGATCVVTDGRGSRRILARDFVTAAFETMLNAGEVLEAVVVPKLSASARFGWHKISRKTGKFAMAIGAVLSDPDRGVFRAVMGATHGPPIVVEDARELFSAPGESRLDEARAAELLALHGVTAPSARRLHLTALRRAAAEAFAP